MEISEKITIKKINQNSGEITPFMEKFRSSVEAFFVKYRDKFIYVHIFMFIGLVAFIVVPAFMPIPADHETAFTNFALFGRYMVWGLWFPLVFLSVIFTGRLWCGLLCPQGALTEYISKLGRRKSIPKWMKYGWVPVLSFIVVTILGQVQGVRDYALPAMLIFIGTTLLSLLVGILYAREKRVWCRYLCPIGPLLGTLSRLGSVSFERKGYAKGWGCPTFIDTTKKVASSDCIECFKCVNPGQEGSLRLEFRRPGLEIEQIDRRNPNIWEAYFIFVVAGLTLGAFHWQANPLYFDLRDMVGAFFLNFDSTADLIGESGPWWIMVNYPEAGEVFNWLDFICITGFMVISMFLVGGLLFSLTYISAYFVKTKEPHMDKVAKLGYIYAPVALVSLVVGLGLIFFESFSVLGLDANTIHLIQATIFILGVLWSLHLARVLQGGISLAIVPNLAGVFAVTYLWFEVLF